jgi:Helicase HerA, central domain
MDLQLAALRAADFDYTQHLENVWSDSPFHVADLNKDIVEQLLDDLDLRTGTEGAPSPLGWVICGPAGTGKTHLLGTLRHQVWSAGGWFIMFDLLDVKDFWDTAGLSYLRSFQRRMPDGRLQSEAILGKLIDMATDGKAPQVSAAVLAGASPDELINLADRLISMLGHKYATEILRHKHVLRALILLHSPDPLTADNAYHWLQGIEVDSEFVAQFGFRQAQASPRDIVQGLSWLMSLTGPTMLAIDQVDAILSEQYLASGVIGEALTSQQRKALSIIEGLNRGIMELRDVTRRTMTILSSFESSWQVLLERSTGAVRGRFHEALILYPIAQAETAADVVAKRVAPAYSQLGFRPPYATWPFRPESFHGVVGLSPRELLKLCDNHRRKCLRDRAVSELTSFHGGKPGEAAPPPPSGDLSALDRRFEGLKSTADPWAPMKGDGEERFGPLLQSAMRCYALQNGSRHGGHELMVDNDFKGDRPPLHTRLRVIERQGDREQHYSFRAVTSANAVAFQSRLRAAMTESGIDRHIGFRRLFVLRRPALPAGAKTTELIQKFKADGGVFVEVKEQDMRVFSALLQLEAEQQEGFEAWLQSRRPLETTHLFQIAGLAEAAEAGRPAGDTSDCPPEMAYQADKPEQDVPPQAPPGSTAQQPAEPSKDTILIGHTPTSQEPVLLDLFALNRHVAIIAGSGSGKSVALRRIVEEAALLGVPAIVIDCNNDLARLGQPWPETPDPWSAEDEARARRYAQAVEVVVWTPLLSRGNPLNLAPIPDFSSVVQDADALRIAVSMVTAALRPYAIPGGGQAAQLREGILTNAIHYFATHGAGTLDHLIALLSELPDEATGDITDAAAHAQKMADQLRSAMARNPLLAASGRTLDPATLFRGAVDKTRISVINLSGLPSDEQRQSFVNQLAMTLFAWIRKHPARAERPLQGLLVIDEAQNFVPAQGGGVSKPSLMQLTQQARKYGLGLIFATQMPKGIAHQIMSNCTTQIFGKQNSPTAIETVQELLSAKGGEGTDVPRLRRGEFYMHTEGFARPVKLHTPLCLSHHPATPPSEHEVVDLARRSINADYR